MLNVMTLPPIISRRIRLIFHNIGLSCLGGALFLQILMFVAIAQNGYFMAIEQNLSILMLEVALTIFSSIYFIYIYQRLIRSIK